MRIFFAWIDPKYLAILLAVLLVFIYDCVQANAPQRLIKRMTTSRDVDFVISHLADSDPEIAEAAAGNISREPDAFEDALIEILANGNRNLRTAALRVIVDSGIEIDPALVLSFLDADFSPLRVQALRYFTRIGESINRQLITDIFIAAKEPKDKATVIEVATEVLPPDEAVEILILGFNDQDKDVKLSAFKRACELPGEASTKVLIEALYYDDLLAPLAEIELRKRGSDAFGQLITALDDGRTVVCATAAGLLGYIGDVRALEPLMELFTDTSYDVRKAAGWSAGKLVDEHQLQIFLEWIQVSRPDSIKAVAAIYALGASGWRMAGDRLLQIASDPGFRDGLRYAAINALGEMGFPPAEEFLLSRAEDEMEGSRIRREALESLGGFPSDESLALLSGMLAIPTDLDFRVSSARGLGRMTEQPEALEVLMRAVENERINIVLAELVRAMGAHGDPIAIPAIEKARAKYVRDIVCDAALLQIELLSSDAKGE